MASFLGSEAASSLPSPSGKGDRAAVDRVLSYIACLRRSPPLFFIPLVPYPARSARHLPHAGKALSVDIVFSHISCIRFDVMGIAVLSYIVDLRRSSPLIFHPARTLSGSLRSPPSPHREGFVSGISLPPSNLRPFWAPPSIGRRECPREPLPLEGAAERSEAGLASFFAAKPPSLSLP